MTASAALTMNTLKFSFGQRIKFLQLIMGCCLMILIYILDKLFNRRIAVFSNDDKVAATDRHNFFGLPEDKHWVYYVVLEVVGFILGIMFCRLILILHLTFRQNGKQSCGFLCAVYFRALICLWDVEVIEMMTLNITLSDDDWDGALSLKSEQSVKVSKLKGLLQDFRK